MSAPRSLAFGRALKRALGQKRVVNDARTAALASLVIAGCAIGPSTHPTITPAGEARAASPSTVDRRVLDSLAAASSLAASPAPLDTTGALAWTQVLRDTQLVALVRTALANNRDVQAAAARVEEYRATWAATRGGLLPQISANGSAARTKTTFGSLVIPTFDQYTVTANLQWELDFFGRLRRSTEAARFDWAGREDDRRATLLSLVSDVSTAYLELRELDEDLAISEQTLASRQQSLKLARDRFAQGVISELDVRQFEAAMGVAAAAVAQYTRLGTQKENQLSLLLGAAPGPIPRGLRLEETVAAVAAPDSIRSTLLMRRPDVMRAQADWSAALARVGVAQASRLPRVTVSGQYGRQSTGLDSLFVSNAQVYSIAAGISIPLFTGGTLVNQQAAARARAEQARLHYEQTLLVALRETSDALAGVRLSKDEVVAQQVQVRALTRGLELAERRYESGVSSYFDVLDVERQLFGAQLILTSTERQYLSSIVQLYKAIGGNW